MSRMRGERESVGVALPGSVSMHAQRRSETRCDLGLDVHKDRAEVAQRCRGIGWMETTPSRWARSRRRWGGRTRWRFEANINTVTIARLVGDRSGRGLVSIP